MNSVVCRFLTKSDTEKSCQITYSDKYCQNEIETILSVSTGNEVVLQPLDLLFTDREYCFMVTARNSGMKVNVTGTYRMETSELIS